MKRLTPQEFAAQWQDPRPIKVIRLGDERPISTIHDESLAELLQAYAEHLEETAWQEIDEMPLVDENGVHSIKILIETPFNGVVEGLVDMENDIWFSATGYKVTPLRWRASPTPPEK